MFDFLENFEKRMEWIGIANSIINRKGKNTELENLFEENEMTNIIISVLLFIMEKTLEENNECEMHHIEDFLDQLTREYYSKAFNQSQVRDIAGYIIKDILQNNGSRCAYPLVNYTKRAVEEITIRLVNDKIIDENNDRRIVYMLTNQGYEFLFRMKEVDEEIQLTIEQLKLKEYIKRKKFSSAVRQSYELIKMVRQKKKDLESFILSIRQNIHSVDIEQYETLMKSTYSMLTEEYDTMDEIQKMIHMAQERIKEETASGRDFDQKLSKARAEIMEIHHNIGLVISEQRDLIINRTSLSDLYMDTIKRSFEFSFEKRYDFEEVILSNLEGCTQVLDNCLDLLKPLFLPARKSVLGIGDVYASQAIIKDSSEQNPHTVSVDEFDDSAERARIKRVGERYDVSVALIISEAMKAAEGVETGEEKQTTEEKQTGVMQTGEVSLSEIINKTREGNPSLYDEIVRDRCIFLVALKLYDIGTVNVSSFYRGSGRVIMQPSEEFNIEYCLVKVKNMIDDIERLRELRVEKTGEEIEVTIERTVDQPAGTGTEEDFAQTGAGFTGTGAGFTETEVKAKSIETVKMSNLVFKAVM